MSDATAPIIGIDLGTTNSCAAVWKAGRIEIVVNSQGDRLTPSCVAFTSTQRLVGEYAKDEMAENPRNTVYSVKRLIGREWHDPTVQSDVVRLPYKVQSSATGEIEINVKWMGQEKRYSPEAISSMVLMDLKEAAENRLGVRVDRAVITVPAYFNDSQRRATIDAGKLAGLKVERIISEPTAAAIAYGLETDAKGEETVLVFDLGGGTLDVSIVSIAGNSFETKAVGGDTHLGGDDFDNCLVQHCKQHIQKTYGVTLKDQGTLNRLRVACEKAKRKLSRELETTITISDAFTYEPYTTVVTRALFDSRCSHLFSACVRHVETTLKDAAAKGAHPKRILLVGGSTRIPKLRTKLERSFPNMQVSSALVADEVVAQGAGMQAALLMGIKQGRLGNVEIRDVTPFSLGIECLGDVFARIINRNTSIPSTKTKVFQTAYDYQKGVCGKVYEGERERASDNFYLGEINLDGLVPALRGYPVEFTFHLDMNGVLEVTERDPKTGRETHVSIDKVRGRHTAQEIQQMLTQAESLKEVDKQWADARRARNELDGLIRDCKRSPTSAMLAKCRTFETWLAANPAAPKARYEERLNELLELKKSEESEILPP